MITRPTAFNATNAPLHGAVPRSFDQEMIEVEDRHGAGSTTLDQHTRATLRCDRMGIPAETRGSRIPHAPPRPREGRTPLMATPRASAWGAELVPRRAFDRAVLHADITCNGDDGFFTGFADNISEGGVFIATHTTHEIGERVAFELTLSGCGCIAAAGEVRWVRIYCETSDAPSGVGLRFIELSAPHAALIADFVSQHETIFWDAWDSNGLPGAMTLQAAPVTHARPSASDEAPFVPVPMEHWSRLLGFYAAGAGAIVAIFAALGLAQTPASQGAAGVKSLPTAPANSETAKVAPESTVQPVSARAESAKSPVTTSAEPPSAEIPQPEIDPASLPPAEGLLVVDAPAPADVYLNGMLRGETGATLRAPCGLRFMRLAVRATPPAPRQRWITRGASVSVGCRMLTRVNSSMIH